MTKAKAGAEVSQFEEELNDLMNKVRTGYAKDCQVEEFGETRPYR